MGKRIFIVALFVAIFGGLWYGMLMLKQGNTAAEVQEKAEVVKSRPVSEGVHSYSANDVASTCSADDKIFCAIELAVKCTLVPELDGCSKDVVPGFVIGKVEPEIRPQHISFEITKIKPLPESEDIAVYTKSDCDASWFGLCKGIVIYSLTPKDGSWRVANVYALEQ